MTQKKQKKLFKLAHSWSCIIVFLQNYIEIFIIFIQSTNQNIFYYNLLTKLASNDSKKYTIRFRKIWSAWKYLKPGADILLLFIEFLFSWINSFFFKEIPTISGWITADYQELTKFVTPLSISKYDSIRILVNKWKYSELFTYI